MSLRHRLSGSRYGTLHCHRQLAAYVLWAVLLGGCAEATPNGGEVENVNEEEETAMSAEAQTVIDQQEIEYLRRWYAKATDAIGRAGDEDVAAGRAIYHQIFTPDVSIRTSGSGDPLTANSPDGWVDVVLDALRDYTGTQHLIGTQLVELNGDEAHMESYVHAWHKNPDGSVYHYLGTYIDKVRRTDEGWRIYDMNLRHDTSGTMQAED